MKNQFHGLVRKARKRSRGSILFLTLLFLVLINMFALAFWKIVPVEMNSAKRHLVETEAYFASDAGVVDSLAFLERQTADGNIDNYINNQGVTNSDGHQVIKRTGQFNGWTWEAEIIPGPDTFGHNNFTSPNPIRVFNIRSIAKRPDSDEQYREVSCWVRQKSFAKDGWGVNGLATGSNTLWLNMATFKLGGTYRVNGEANVDIPGNSFWSNSEPAIGGELLFSVASTNSRLNTVVDGVNYKDFNTQSELPYNMDTGAAIPGRYEKIVQTGEAGVRQVTHVDLPLSTDNVGFGVYGDELPTNNLNRTGTFFGEGHSGGYVRARINQAQPGQSARNGIYIEGDVDQVEFRTVRQAGNGNLVNVTDHSSLNGTENQAIRIYQGGSSNGFVEVLHITDSDYTIPNGTTVVDGTHSTGTTLRPSDNDGKGWTVVRDGRTNQIIVYKEQTNGAIYSTGDIEGVRGIVKGRRTVATQTDTGNSTSEDRRIRINGELLYAGTTPGDTPATTHDMLGLISYAVKMTSNQAEQAPTNGQPELGEMWPRRGDTSETNPHYLYASIFAGRRVDPNASSFITAGGFGVDSYNDGNLGKGHMKLFGSINERIRLAKGTYNSQGGGSGYGYAFELDPGLEQVQPPFFPTLPDYDVMTWEERSVFAL